MNKPHLNLLKRPRRTWRNPQPKKIIFQDFNPALISNLRPLNWEFLYHPQITPEEFNLLHPPLSLTLSDLLPMSANSPSPSASKKAMPRKPSRRGSKRKATPMSRKD